MRYNIAMKRAQLAVLTHKNTVDRHITTVLTSFGRENRHSGWASDAVSHLVPYVTGGKTIRGSLAVYAYRMFLHDTPRKLLDAAAALEFVHSGLLIHDDIMDKDMIRRGKASIHSQYDLLAASENGREAAHFGISQGINLGDLCMFLAVRLISSAGPKTNSVLGKELAGVALGQMTDVAGSHLLRTLSRQEIISLYTQKTARYTFSLPLYIGSTIAGADAGVVHALDTLGEKLGLLFQIRDDELSESGNPAITGKPAGSDAENNKQTLAQSMSAKELDSFRRQLQAEASNIIYSLHVSSTYQQELTKLLSFCENRKS